MRSAFPKPSFLLSEDRGCADRLHSPTVMIITVTSELLITDQPNLPPQGRLGSSKSWIWSENQ